ncbi:MAG TPA: hypothetical protein PKE26_03405 [Kiritimatiellia bacterium]|nr:hypothetical protein [Kiritimatiellia bacterium]HMO98136.1 hypothetical protein [Kiritimatiellia bacterium]HMP96192.1 hypothetical protein [Kiritimatiellia bacterium]
MSNEAIQSIVTTCYLSILDVRGIPHPPEINRDTLMFGEGGPIDSMGIVMMVVDVEEAVRAKFGQTVSLADDRAMSQRNSPYRSIGSLTDYIAAQLDGVS